MKKSLLLCLLVLNLDVFAGTPINSGASFDIGFSPDGNSLDLVLQGIRSAKKSIHVAAYSFTSKPIAAALIAAKNRGVEVRVVADQKSSKDDYSVTGYIAAKGIQVRTDGNYAIFHQKFIVIDGVSLETGSFNFSSSAATRNSENVLVLWNVPQIAQTYETKWSQLWNESLDLK